MTAIFHHTLCIEPDEGILEELPATFFVIDGANAELVSFKIGAFTGSRDQAIAMTGEAHIKRQEASAVDAYHDYLNDCAIRDAQHRAWEAQEAAA